MANENAKHTPGPLKAARAFRDNAPDCFVVSVAKWGGENTAVCNKEADARLYAAAPELLAALEWALKNIEEIALPEFEKQGRVTSLDNCAAKARAAIDKANGK